MMPLAKCGLLLSLAALAAAGCSAQTPDQAKGDATAGATGAPSAQAPAGEGAATPEPRVEASVEAGAVQAPAKAAPLPAEVAAFIERRDMCDHFRGEEAYDQERKAFLDRKLEETCKGTDAALKSIRRKYRDDPGVISALWDYDDVVE
ncbi:MAG: hypothetical protein NTX28_13180 [Novosphingobium sp.]|nr:hypothetical protein [Novosphingobium sp.]